MSADFRLALIGAGGFAGAHIKAAERIPQAQITAVVASSRRRFAGLTERFPGLHCTTNLDQVLGDPSIDGVIICAPHDQHLQLGLSAIEHRKHVLIEKPMAMNTADGVRLVTAANANGCILQVGQCERFDPDLQRVKQTLDAGAIGPVHSVRIDAMQNAAAFIPSHHWYRDGKRAGGGVTRSVGVHRLDLVRWLFGEPAWVQAHSATIDPRFINGAEDLMTGTIGWENGLLASFVFSWAAARAPYSEGLIAFGERGTLHCMPSTPQQFGPPMMSTWDGERIAHFADQFGYFHQLDDPCDLPSHDPVTNQAWHFIDCCRQQQQPLTAGLDNLGTLALVEAVEVSATHSGQRTAVERLDPIAVTGKSASHES